MSDATYKNVLKQATQRALFRGVTFGIGWSYFWKKSLVPKRFSIYYLIFELVCKKCHFMLKEDVYLCKTHSGEASFQYQVFIFVCVCWTAREVVLFSRKWACVLSWSNLPNQEVLILKAQLFIIGSYKLQVFLSYWCKQTLNWVRHQSCCNLYFHINNWIYYVYGKKVSCNDENYHS